MSKFSKKLGSLKPEPADARSRVVGEANASAAARQVQKVPNCSLSSIRPLAVSCRRETGSAEAWA